MQRTPASRKGSAENRGNSCQRNWARAAPPTVAARTRIVSVARIRLDHRKSVRPFKGIICDDVSEFESHMPSQAVLSLWDHQPTCRSDVSPYVNPLKSSRAAASGPKAASAYFAQ